VASSKKQGPDDWEGRNHDADEAGHLSLLLHADATHLANADLDPVERGKLLTRVRRTQRAYLGHDPQAETRERRRIMANALETAQHVGADRAKALAIARAVLTLGTYRAQAEKVPDDLLWNAIEVWPRMRSHPSRTPGCPSW
jgi:hypothetical protein